MVSEAEKMKRSEELMKVKRETSQILDAEKK